MTAHSTATAFASVSIVLLLAMLGCSPSSKNELKHWENNQKSAAEFKAAWPGFAVVIDARVAAARTAFDAATKEADETRRGEQMKAANAIAGEFKYLALRQVFE